MQLDKLSKNYLDESFVLKSEFLSSDYNREEVLTRCERYAGWTLPRVFPNDPLMEYDEMQNDFQSVGARAVTNLANKIMMALFQPTRPFFKLTLEEKQILELAEAGIEQAAQETALANVERDAMKDLTKRGARVALLDILLQLIVTGNSLLYSPMGDKDEMQVYSLRDYTIKRDLRGKLVKLIIKEFISVSGLSDEMQALALAEGYSETDDIAIYTAVHRVGKDKYIVWQELEDLCYCHKKLGVYTSDSLPWIPLTWTLARGKDYGSGLVEEYSGDFHSLSTIAEAILDFTTVVTDIKTLVNPTGMTNVREISESASGAYVHGREEDLSTYSADVSNVTDFLEKQFSAIEKRIGAAFLLTSAITRDAERVTAVEIRQQAFELEGSVGGVYSRLARDLQTPLAKRLVAKQNSFFKGIEPTIVTGLDSLSRNNELDNLRAFISDLAMLEQVPEEVRVRLKIGDVIAIIGNGHGVDHTKMSKDESTVKKDAEDRANLEAEAQEKLQAAKATTA